MSWGVLAKGTFAEVRKQLADSFAAEGTKQNMEGDGHAFVPDVIEKQLQKQEAYYATPYGKQYMDTYFPGEVVEVFASGSVWGGGLSLKIDVQATRVAPEPVA